MWRYWMSTLAARVWLPGRPRFITLSGCSGGWNWRRTTRALGGSGNRRQMRRLGSRPVQTGLRMRRGEMWLVDLDPVRGKEANKRRPAIVVSNDSANAVAARL